MSQQTTIRIEATRSNTANPFRDVRHMTGLHKRVEQAKAGKGSYSRKVKHKGRGDC